jgi:quercetin dioxygenase-like cupin family protein
MKSIASLALLALCATTSAAAQDPAKVDSRHYQVLFEDAEIRVLRITYRPGEKSVMHEHPAGGCTIMLTAGQPRFTAPDTKPKP